MLEADIETILQRAREKFPEARPRIISDNGPQFIESPRLSRRLHLLRGWSHGKTEDVFCGNS
jgi:hypothetical protein